MTPQREPKSFWRRLADHFKRPNNSDLQQLPIELDDHIVEPSYAEVEAATAYLFWARCNAHADGCMCHPCTDARQTLSDAGKLYETVCALDKLPRSQG